jgi:hypothetical protein
MEEVYQRPHCELRSFQQIHLSMAVPWASVSELGVVGE